MQKGVSWYLVRADGRDKKHCRKWRVVLRFPYDRALRRRPTRSFTVYGMSCTQAAKEAQKAAQDASTGRIVSGRSPSVRDWSSAWNDSRLEKGTIGAKTHEKNANMLNAACLHIGDIKLRDVRASDIDAAYIALASGDSPSGKKWSGTSLKTLHGVLSAMFSSACAQGMAGINPMDGVEPPRDDTKERKALSIADSADLMGRLDLEDAREWCAWLMLATGMRCEEALSVKFGDIREEGIEIRRETTKTDAGARVIPLNLATKSAILAKYGQIGADSGTNIVCNADKTAITYNNMRKWWSRARKRLRMDGWTLHELRHTFASNLAEANIQPKVMQKLMGHASESTTLRIYTHVHSEQETKAMQDLADAREKSVNFAKEDAKSR